MMMDDDRRNHEDPPYTTDPLLKGIEFLANKLFEAFVFLGLSIIAHGLIIVFK